MSTTNLVNKVKGQNAVTIKAVEVLQAAQREGRYIKLTEIPEMSFTLAEEEATALRTRCHTWKKEKKSERGASPFGDARTSKNLALMAFCILYGGVFDFNKAASNLITAIKAA